MTFWQFLVAHSTVLLAAGLLMFKTAVNALPLKGQPFQAGQWFMEWMRELAQQAPNKEMKNESFTETIPGKLSLSSSTSSPAPAGGVHETTTANPSTGS